MLCGNWHDCEGRAQIIGRSSIELYSVRDKSFIVQHFLDWPFSNRNQEARMLKMMKECKEKRNAREKEGR